MFSENWELTDHICSFVLRAEVEVNCGMHKWEQHPERPTRLLITVRMYAKLAPGPASGQQFINYDGVRSYLKSLRDHDHTPLIETIADGITKVCFSDDRVDVCQIRIEKPDIFNEADAAGIEVFRTRASWEKQ